MPRKLSRCIDALTLSVIVLAFFLPSPAWATFAGDNCSFPNNDQGYSLSTWKRSQAKSYADVAYKEGYQWGGGCWDNDNKDDQPGDPVQTSGTNGEGGDCSGFTFKAWALDIDAGQGGFTKWTALQFKHGPYVAASYHSPTSSNNAFAKVNKSNAVEMDAFASSSHIGFIFTANTSQGQDRILEALCEACGTTKGVKNYRSSSSYNGVKRKGWTPECYPNCTGP